MTLKRPIIKLEEIKVGTMPILESKDVQERLDNLFNQLEDFFRNRFNDFQKIIDTFSEEKNFSNKISYENTVFFFKQYFLMQVVNDAVKIALTETTGKYDILENILFLISEQSISKAILGKPMINAYSKVICNLPCKTSIDYDVHAGLTVMLRSHLGYDTNSSVWYYFD